MLAQLPLLTEQELGVLELALIKNDGDLEVEETCGVADATENRRVNASLLTAVREAQATLRSRRQPDRPEQQSASD